MASVMSKKSPAQPGIFALVREFFGNATGHGDLLISFVHADLHARHRDKALGVLWTVGDPLMMMLVYVFIVTMVFKHHSADYPIYVYSGLISWRYFAHCTQGASAALASKGVSLNASIRSLGTGGEAGAMIFLGFTYCPFFFIRKSRCGPVDMPELPTYPMTCP